MEVSDWGVGDTHDLCSYWMDTSWTQQLEQAKLFVDVLIGASLSEPHTSVISLHSACVCLLAWTDHLP